MKTGRRVLVVLMGGFFAAMAARLIVSPIVPYAVSTFNTTPGVLGLSLSGMWLAYALAQLPAGVLAAQYGTRPLIVAGLLLTAAASGLLAIAPSVLVFAIAVVSLGIGPGLYFPAAAVLLTETSENVGEALGLHLAGGDSAGIVVPLVVTVIAGVQGWQAAPLVGLFVAGSMAVIAVFALPQIDGPAPKIDSSKKELTTALNRVIHDPAVRRIVLLAGCLTFCFQSVTSFLPAYLHAAHNLSIPAANTRFSLAFAIWIIGMPLAGRLADRLGANAVLIATALILATGVAILILATSSLIVLIGVALLGLGMSWGGVLGAKTMTALGRKGRTSGYGAVRAMYGIIGATGSVAVGTFATWANWQIGWSLLFIVATLALLILGWDIRKEASLNIG